MNQAALLRESRSKHLLQSYEAAVRQFRAFRDVQPKAAGILMGSTRALACSVARPRATAGGPDIR